MWKRLEIRTKKKKKPSIGHKSCLEIVQTRFLRRNEKREHGSEHMRGRWRRTWDTEIGIYAQTTHTIYNKKHSGRKKHEGDYAQLAILRWSRSIHESNGFVIAHYKRTHIIIIIIIRVCGAIYSTDRVCFCVKHNFFSLSSRCVTDTIILL